MEIFNRRSILSDLICMEFLPQLFTSITFLACVIVGINMDTTFIYTGRLGRSDAPRLVCGRSGVQYSGPVTLLEISHEIVSTAIHPYR